ncbi:phosphosulfolactate synthase [Salipaludibacillus sp. CF4.18]|uniref:phosphosulfolactate synthase n=1 Tax=Salipaludibacillus sp. CF4.18 TaxID=3373081 RepID=UPI003EE458C4
MRESGLNLPIREPKPRENGLTILIDNGLSTQLFKDMINSSPDLIDFVKFGWGTSVITRQLEEKMLCLHAHGIEFFFGGTLFEKFLSQHKLDDFYNYCKEFNCKYIEISNGTIDITNKEKASYISDFSSDFQVFSEVGYKDCDKSELITSTEWVEYIQEDFEAGAVKVITEARESGTSGLCTKDGEIKLQYLQDILAADINMKNIIFEAPLKKLQALFIKMIGPEVNLANIAFQDIISLETLRLGLRSDTFYLVNLDWGSLHERQK